MRPWGLRTGVLALLLAVGTGVKYVSDGLDRALDGADPDMGYVLWANVATAALAATSLWLVARSPGGRARWLRAIPAGLALTVVSLYVGEALGVA